MTLEVLTDASLRGLNTFGVEARARLLVRLRAEHELEAAARVLAGRRPFVLGGGSNLLLTRDIDAPVLHLALRGRQVLRAEDEDPLVEAAAGEPWHRFVMWTLSRGLFGLENLSLIPGLVGASPIQNIGAYGLEMSERFDSLRAWDPDSGEIRRFFAADCGFGYRDSAFRRPPLAHWVVLSVRFRLSRRPQPRLEYGELRRELAARAVDRPGAREVADAVIAIRRRKLPDPARIGNAGSFFRNPSIDSARAETLRREHPDLPLYPLHDAAAPTAFRIPAAWLIERCGWKGHRQGGAGVHAEHALVLVNHGDARGAEILALALRIQRSVEERFGIALEPEPRIV
ncbi:MAG: UDP-N-acetylmuramate dehydrogenase [Burkholderiales bacterium]|nr:MAG: UDP-N-acetylmuramate dehydrogenase [Burkholderiales bacterium]